MGRIASALFPDDPRAFPGRRTLKISLRAAHVFCAGVLVGAFLLGAADGARTAWLWATVGTGGALLLLDLHETAACLLQVRGIVVMVKLAVVGALPWLGAAQVWALGGLLVLSVLSSHAPGGIRHRLWAGAGRVTGADSKG